MNEPEPDAATDLRILLREQVLAGEPPFDTTARTWHQTGPEVVRRRRLRVAAGFLAVTTVAAAAVVATVVNGPSPLRGIDIPPAAQRILDDFDPDTFPGIADTEIRNRLDGAIPADLTGRVEPTLGGYARLRPEDYSFSDAWTATYQLSATDRIMVILQKDQSSNDGSADRYCRENLARSDFERCDHTTLPDGTVSIFTVSKTRYTPSGYIRARAKDDPDTWWFQRQVFNRRDYGFGVIAREYVKATSLAQADERWAATPDELAAVAASPTLVFRLPPARDDCQLGYQSPISEDDFVDVRCS